jgi:hypothetical protein
MFYSFRHKVSSLKVYFLSVVLRFLFHELIVTVIVYSDSDFGFDCIQRRHDFLTVMNDNIL